MIEPAIIQALRTDSLWIGQPHSTGVPGQWTLQFGRRLDTADGAFAGAALLSNMSYEKDAIIHWDPIAMKIV